MKKSGVYWAFSDFRYDSHFDGPHFADQRRSAMELIVHAVPGVSQTSTACTANCPALRFGLQDSTVTHN
jgi:hypothetical protein